jgi:uncharacterized protein (DUF2141 family)
VLLLFVNPHQKESVMRFVFSSARSPLFVLWLGAASAAAPAGDLVVNVSGANSTQGQIGCTLFESSAGFPMESGSSRQIWQAVDGGGVICRFTDVAPGTYAVSVGRDLNGNKRVDTNALGIPKEGWGVSNNVVPTLRAPRFNEARFDIKDAALTSLDIKLVY